MKTKLRKGDLVRIVAGKHHGKQGLVTRLQRQHHRVFVEGIKTVKHVKPSQSNTQGEIRSVDVSIDWSNVMVINPKNKKEVTRIYYLMKDGQKQRMAVKSHVKLK